MQTDLYIGGKWLEAANKERFDVFNPADETIIAAVASATQDDAKLALDAADGAFMAWAAKKPRERAEILRTAFELLIDRKEEFARLITLENGKAQSDALGEIAYAAEFFRWYAEEAVRVEGSIAMSPSSGARILVQPKPAGICLLVTPWNYPVAMGTRKIAPALAAGCPVIIKPASATPLTMLALMSLLEEAGVPPGVVNVLPSKNSGQIVHFMLQDPRVRVVSFTGSTEVGKKILHSAAEKIVNPAMELGGNAPLIVFEDADIDTAVEGCMLAKMRNLGEACTAANRIYVHQQIHDPFVQKLTEKMAALKMGNGLDQTVDIGPLVNAATRDKVAFFVKDSVQKGAKIILGGTQPEGKGFFYPPTILTAVPDHANCMQDEIFGPVAAIQAFNDSAQIVQKANETHYGLIAYVFTQDLKRGLQVSEQLEFGMIGLNRGIASDPAAPFGGVKQSGIGREGRREGIEEFMEMQYISVSW